MTWKNLQTWLKEGIIGVLYLLISFLLTYLATLNTFRLITILKMYSVIMHHFIADVFVDLFYSGNVLAQLYSLFVSPLSLYYQILRSTNINLIYSPYTFLLIYLVPAILFFSSWLFNWMDYRKNKIF